MEEPRASTPAADSSKWDRGGSIIGGQTDISTQIQMSVPTQPEGRVEAVYIPSRVEGRKLLLTPATDQTDHFIVINKPPSVATVTVRSRCGFLMQWKLREIVQPTAAQSWCFPVEMETGAFPRVYLPE